MDYDEIGRGDVELFKQGADRFTAGVHVGLRPGQHDPVTGDVTDAGAGLPLLSIEIDSICLGKVARAHKTDVVSIARV